MTIGSLMEVSIIDFQHCSERENEISLETINFLMEMSLLMIETWVIFFELALCVGERVNEFNDVMSITSKPFQIVFPTDTHQRPLINLP
jgi:hypothetical protein